ncbi:DMT family transporter [Paenirhodobacter populi]|uniref:DMT family transporter n=1 Tax=Paenirhodobacter populi TaxID=2306993 RepID=A0A443J676_9RHOB|nr:DMT family transporter [Sinirhodobacter populi]RWR15946.1 DMT family transporter [Sinirhodobacter populi]
MLVGILAGLATCALWGLSFVAPRAVEPFTALDLTIARYGIFGLVSALLMILPRFRPKGLSCGQWLRGMLLGGAGYIGYFIAVAHAVRLAGPAIPPLVIGLMPVVLALIANARDAALNWARLLPPLMLIGAGVLIVNASTLRAADAPPEVLPGILAALLALAIWIVYGLVNSAVMTAPDAPDGLQWTVVQGLGAGVGSLCLLPLTSPTIPPEGHLTGFILWALVMGLAGSWLATWFWVIASHRLPLALAAQLIVAETVFGLTFGFAFEGRAPSVAEAFGASIQIVGVCLAIWAFQHRNRQRE